MKVTDYIVNCLADHGARHVFGLTGGAVVHLFDSAERSGRLRPIFHHHEQAAAFAAQTCARVTEKIGVCFITTGPGVTNALTGLAAAWLDSVPCIFISGQARVAHTTAGRRIRQLGTQQIDVVPLVQSMTKYAVMLTDANAVRYEMEKALHLATTGRPGPVWIDLPLDLQWADVKPESLPAFHAPASEVFAPRADAVEICRAWLQSAQRPLVLAGYGVPRSGARDIFSEFIAKTGLPFVTTWGAADLMPTAHPLNLGRPGVAGQRGANLAVQNCDLLLVLGSHLNIPVTGTMFESFARAARIVMVDIDPVELEERTIPVHLPIAADVQQFLRALLQPASKASCSPTAAWLAACDGYRERSWTRPAAQPGAISPYEFVRTLSSLSDPDDLIVIDGGGTNVYTSFQTFEIKGRQRLLLSTALCSMGSGFPESVGACFGGDGRRTLCLCGDGSAQLNIQELQTIFHHRLPVKIFISANGGYLSIRGTQKEFLSGNYVGSEAVGGMSLPDYTRVAAAYGLPVYEIRETGSLASQLAAMLAAPGPAVAVIHTSPVQEITPRQGFRQRANGTFAPRPLEDMAPLLERPELAAAMLVPAWSEETP